MTVLLPRTIAEACAAVASHPNAHLLSGGTDLMVEVNSGRRRPQRVIALSGIEELREWSSEDGDITIGAGVTFARLASGELASLFPALAMAARTVGSSQIRNAATIGGNIGTSSPAGDSLPVLAALEARIVLQSSAGVREVPIADFCVGPKRTDRHPDELITALRIRPTDGPQEFCKLGTRQAMAISIASVAVIADRAKRNVRVGLGAVGPVPLRAREAEAFAAENIDWATGQALDPQIHARFGSLVAEASHPIDDHRSSLAYRRHAVGVLATRALRRMFP